MKSNKMRNLLLAAALMLQGTGLLAQVVLNETFSGGAMPPAGWTIDAQTSNWSISGTANAGGSSPEAKMTWSPEFNTTTRLISPAIDLTGAGMVLVQFRHMIDHYSGSYQIGIATRTGAGSWTPAWSRTISSGVSAEQVSVPISNNDTGNPGFQFCIYFSGSSYNLNDWFIDDITLTIPENTDAAVTHISTPTYFTGPADVTATITNMGINALNAFNVNWQVDDNDVHTEQRSGQNIQLGGSVSITFQNQVELSAGTYDLKVWVSNVNGATGSDDAPENDTLTKTIRIPVQLVPRKPFFEEFTSSTCAPCASFNNSVLNPFINQNGDEIVLVKYQMNWPGSGDPYYTAEGGARRNYYGVNAVPMLFVDGKNVATSSAGVNTAFNNSLNNIAFVDIAGHYTIEGTNVSIDAAVTSYTDIDNATLYVVIFEGVTTQNKRTNGETEFHHVMMRILPNGNGSAASLESNVPMQVNHVVDMTGTNVEEMSDLFVAIFLQDNQSKEIFQAAYATLAGALVSSQPANLAVNVPVDEPLVIDFSQPVRLIGGEELTPENVQEIVTLELLSSRNIPVNYSAEVNAEKTRITITPDQNLEETSIYRLTVAALENENGVQTYTYSSEFATETGTNTGSLIPSAFRIYPNPAQNFLFVEGSSEAGNNAELLVTDLSGKIVRRALSPQADSETTALPLLGLGQGTYLITLKGEKGAFTRRFVVIK